MFRTEFEKVEDRAEMRAKQNVLLMQMGEKFKSVPDAVTRRVRSLEDPDTLDGLLRKLMYVNDLGELGL